MEERDLFELAALAAGVTPGRFDAAAGGFVLDRPLSLCAPGRGVWNPRDDDGDALRLAVRLGMVIRCAGLAESRPLASAYAPGFMGDEVSHDGDPMAATRSAIFHTAVEIGLSLREALAEAEASSAFRPWPRPAPPRRLPAYA